MIKKLWWSEQVNDFVEEEADNKDAAILLACNLCCCGSTEDAKLLWEVLLYCNRVEDRVVGSDEGCYRSPAWELAAKVLDQNDLVEHGTGIGWPWTTEKGKAFIKKWTEEYYDYEFT